MDGAFTHLPTWEDRQSLSISLIRFGMRSNRTVLLLLSALALWGCSPKKPVVNEDPSNASPSRAFTIVESQDTQERKQIEAPAMPLFTNQPFSKLDALAAKYPTAN